MVVLGVGQNLSQSSRVGSVSGGEIGCLIVAWWIIVVVKFKLLINPCRQRLGTTLICNDSIYYTLSLHNTVLIPHNISSATRSTLKSSIGMSNGSGRLGLLPDNAYCVAEYLSTSSRNVAPTSSTNGSTTSLSLQHEYFSSGRIYRTTTNPHRTESALKRRLHLRRLPYSCMFAFPLALELEELGMDEAVMLDEWVVEPM